MIAPCAHKQTWWQSLSHSDISFLATWHTYSIWILLSRMPNDISNLREVKKSSHEWVIKGRGFPGLLNRTNFNCFGVGLHATMRALGSKKRWEVECKSVDAGVSGEFVLAWGLALVSRIWEIDCDSTLSWSAMGIFTVINLDKWKDYPSWLTSSPFKMRYIATKLHWLELWPYAPTNDMLWL